MNCIIDRLKLSSVMKTGDSRLQKKIHKHPEPESEAIHSTDKTPTINENQTTSKANETDEDFAKPTETALNDQPYVETETLRPSIFTDQISPEPKPKIADKEMRLNMTKRTNLDQKQFARSIFVGETYYSSAVRPSTKMTFRFYTCILFFIVM